MDRWLILEPKHRVFERMHERARMSPNPADAEDRFRRRLRQARSVHTVRLGAYVGLYFSFGAAVAGLALGEVAAFEHLRAAIGMVARLASSLTIVFLAAVLVANRFDALVQIELHYYSAEAQRKEPASGDLT